MYIKKLSASDWLKISAYFINTSRKTTKFKVKFTFSTHLLTLNYLLYSPTNTAPQFL